MVKRRNNRKMTILVCQSEKSSAKVSNFTERLRAVKKEKYRIVNSEILAFGLIKKADSSQTRLLQALTGHDSNFVDRTYIGLPTRSSKYSRDPNASNSCAPSEFPSCGSITLKWKEDHFSRVGVTAAGSAPTTP